MDYKVIKPNSIKQTNFLKTSADVAFYGGAAGGGKTYALLLECLYHIDVKSFYAMIIRKSYKEIIQPGSLWDAAVDLYTPLGGEPNKTKYNIYFKNKSKINFSYLEREDQLYKYQGSQIPLICFDEVTHFTKKMFFYLFSRNRSTCGVKPKVRATCNPDPNSWVRNFIDWYIDDQGYIDENKCGVIRYFVHYNDEIYWFDSKEEAYKAFPDIDPKSFTFISANIKDNKHLMESNPSYISSLQALDSVEKERLLYGNWNAIYTQGGMFNRLDFKKPLDIMPRVNMKKVRAWDFAATEPSKVNPDPDYTVGLLLGKDDEGMLYVLDVIRARVGPDQVEKLIEQTAAMDGYTTKITIPEDPGSAGKSLAKRYYNILIKHSRHVIINKITGSKEHRAQVARVNVASGNVRLIKGEWNSYFLSELDSFPIGSHDDQVDAFSDACLEHSKENKIKIINKPMALRL